MQYEEGIGDWLSVGIGSLSCFSAGRLLRRAELSLKVLVSGVGGADVWVADCEEYDSSDWEDDPELGDGFEVGVGLLSVEKLMLHFAPGTSFILSGSYSLSPSVSLRRFLLGSSRNGKSDQSPGLSRLFRGRHTVV